MSQSYESEITSEIIPYIFYVWILEAIIFHKEFYS